MIESEHFDDDAVEELEQFWDQEEETDDLPSEGPRWRRSMLVVVAAVTAAAMAILPLYNVLFGRSTADNGLEVCGFDYCIVQDAMRAAGAGEAMSRLSTVFLEEDEARDLADRLTDHLDIDPIELRVVQDLEGRLGGVYDPATRSIMIERPARAWTVLHEVAHAVETGHGAAFQQVLADLAIWFDQAAA